MAAKNWTLAELTAKPLAELFGLSTAGEITGEMFLLVVGEQKKATDAALKAAQASRVDVTKPRIAKTGKVVVTAGFDMTAKQLMSTLKLAAELSAIVKAGLATDITETKIVERGGKPLPADKQYSEFRCGTVLLGFKREHAEAAREFFKAAT